MARTKTDSKRAQSNQVAPRMVDESVSSPEGMAPVVLVNQTPIRPSVAVEDSEDSAKSQRYMVTRGGPINSRGSITTVPTGAVVDDLNFDIDHLRASGITLQLI